jgi:hypothetical protein
MHNQLYNNDNYKGRTLDGGGMHRCLPLLKKGRKLVLSFMNLDPQDFASNLLAWRHKQTYGVMKCNALKND